MNRKKLILIALGVIGSLALISIGIVKKLNKSWTPQAEYVIGILQTASHPALDAARNGFINELKHRLGNNVDFISYNAQGSISSAQTIAQHLHANRSIKGIYAIATPALQACASVEKTKPIFIAAVTDPASLSYDSNANNICGARDMINATHEIELITSLTPEVKKVAILYNNAEPNALVQVKNLKEELIKKGIEVLDVGLTQENELPTAVALACKKADAILTPTDNLIASTMEYIANQAKLYKKPLYACHNQAVEQGALASRGVDYEENGRQAAAHAYAVLIEGKTPQEIGYTLPNHAKIYINKKTLDCLELKVPASLESSPIILV